MIQEYYGLFFDTDTKEVLDNNLEVLSEGEFRSFPLIPSAKGLAEFKRLFAKAIGNGYIFITKIGYDNGKPALLVTVSNETTSFLEDYPFGKTLETRIRHRSDQAAANQIVDAVRSLVIERNAKEN